MFDWAEDILPIEQVDGSAADTSPDELTPDISEVEEPSAVAPIEQVIEVYEGNQAKTDAVLHDIAQDVVTLSDAVEGVQGELEEVTSALAGVRSAEGDSETVYVVTLDDAQWQELRDVWGNVRPTIAVGLYLVLVLALLSAAILGNHLWVAVSKGWRK